MRQPHRGIIPRNKLRQDPEKRAGDITYEERCKIWLPPGLQQEKELVTINNLQEVIHYLGIE